MTRWLPRTLAAHLSAIRSLYRWMAAEGIVEGDAVSAIASPKLPRDLPGVLTTQQVEALLKTPDTSTPAGLRDAAMLELLYASGARISELAALNVESISWSERTLRLWGKGSKERIVPLYRRALDVTRSMLCRSRGGRSCSLRQSAATLASRAASAAYIGAWQSHERRYAPAAVPYAGDARRHSGRHRPACDAPYLCDRLA